MAQFDIKPDSEDLSGFVWAIYALQFLTPFSGGLALLVSGAIAYMKHDESIGRMEQSHLLWQIKTFWVGLVVGVLGYLLLLVGIGVIVLALISLWIIYRAIKGGYSFSQNREIDNSGLF